MQIQHTQARKVKNTRKGKKPVKKKEKKPVSSAKVSSAKVSSAKVSSAKVSSVKVSSAKVSSAKVSSAKKDARTSKILKKVSEKFLTEEKNETLSNPPTLAELLKRYE